tara:strand:+ start:469 stop:1401 length:933 start_codon:yes stop_codon:yes gene_type:complete
MFKWIITCLLWSYVAASVEQLTVENFDLINSQSEYLLINFYLGEDSMEETMDELSNNGPTKITYARSNDTILAVQLDVTHVPKLKWFMRGDEYEFRGDYTYGKVLQLLISATSNWAQPLETPEHLENFLALQDHDAVVVSNDLEVDLKSLTIMLPSLRFGHLRYDAATLFPEGTLRVYHNFNGSLTYVEFDGEGNIIPWLKNQTTPRVVSTDWKIFNVVYDYSDWHLLFFGVDDWDLQRIAVNYSPKIIFVRVREDHQYLRDKFNVTESPACIFVNKTNKILNHTTVPLDSVVDYIDFTILGEERPKDEL